MKKKVALFLCVFMLMCSATTCYAAPMGTYAPFYTPVSQQSWYKDLQKILGNFTLTYPKPVVPEEKPAVTPPTEEKPETPPTEEKPIVTPPVDNSFKLIKPASGKMNDFFYSEAKRIGLDKKMSDRDAYKIIADYIVDYMTYDYNVNSLNDRNYMNKKGNCNAYCLLNELFCKMRGIQIEIYAGSQKENDWSTAHVWNRVKIDGKWYWSDLTHYQNGYKENILFEKDRITVCEQGHLNVIYDRNFRKIGTLSEAMSKMEW